MVKDNIAYSFNQCMTLGD